MLGFFAKKLSCSDYAKKKSERKDIYTFIHAISRKLVELADDSFDVDDKKTPGVIAFREKILPKLGPSFKALKKAAEVDQEAGEVDITDQQLNERLKKIELRRTKLKADKIVKHFSPEEEKKLGIQQEEAKSLTESPKQALKTMKESESL